MEGIGPEYPIFDDQMPPSSELRQVEAVRRALLGIPPEATPVPWTFRGERMYGLDVKLPGNIMQRRLFTLKHGELSTNDLNGQTRFTGWPSANSDR